MYNPITNGLIVGEGVFEIGGDIGLNSTCHNPKEKYAQQRSVFFPQGNNHKQWQEIAQMQGEVFCDVECPVKIPENTFKQLDGIDYQGKI